MTAAKNPPGKCNELVLDIPDIETGRREYQAHLAHRPDHLQAYLDPEKYRIWSVWSRKNTHLRTRLDMAEQVERSRPVTVYLPEKAAACEAQAFSNPQHDLSRKHRAKGIA